MTKQKEIKPVLFTEPQAPWVRVAVNPADVALVDFYTFHGYKRINADGTPYKVADEQIEDQNEVDEKVDADEQTEDTKEVDGLVDADEEKGEEVEADELVDGDEEKPKRTRRRPAAKK